MSSCPRSRGVRHQVSCRGHWWRWAMSHASRATVSCCARVKRRPSAHWRCLRIRDEGAVTVTVVDAGHALDVDVRQVGSATDWQKAQRVLEAGPPRPPEPHHGWREVELETAGVSRLPLVGSRLILPPADAPSLLALVHHLVELLSAGASPAVDVVCASRVQVVLSRILVRRHAGLPRLAGRHRPSCGGRGRKRVRSRAPCERPCRMHTVPTSEW